MVIVGAVVIISPIFILFLQFLNNLFKIFCIDIFKRLALFEVDRFFWGH